jgi:hypothetical protein
VIFLRDLLYIETLSCFPSHFDENPESLVITLHALLWLPLHPHFPLSLLFLNLLQSDWSFCCILNTSCWLPPNYFFFTFAAQSVCNNALHIPALAQSVWCLLKHEHLSLPDYYLKQHSSFRLVYIPLLCITVLQSIGY